MQADEKNRLYSKLDGIETRLDSIDRTLVKQHGQLELHIRRTEINETAILDIVGTIKPIQNKINQVEGVFKLFGVMSAFVAFVVGIIKVYSFLF